MRAGQVHALLGEAVGDPGPLLELIDRSPLFVQLFDLDGHPHHANPALVRRFGAAPPREYCVFEDPVLVRQGLAARLRQAFVDGEATTLPAAWYDAHAQSRYDTTGVTRGRIGIRVTAVPLADQASRVRCVVALGEDVTAELELAALRERQLLAFAAARLVALDSNVTRGTIELSDDPAGVLGLPAGAAPPVTLEALAALVHPDDRAAFLVHERRCPEHDDPAGHADAAFRLATPPGAPEVWLERRAQAWRDDVTGDLWRRGILLDVSERMRLRQAEKLEALGRVAGGVAHDFNNMLTVILSFGERLRADPRLPAHLAADADAICQAGERAAELTRRLLAFSRPPPTALATVDLARAVRAATALMRPVLGDRVELSVRAPAEPALVRADPAQLEQVVTNLLLNARDAMPGGGRLGVAVESLPAEVVLEVTDTGTGMDAATQVRIFEPFFTTKPPGKGTGLGLATVLGVVQRSGARISVDSRPGRGTSFRLSFPRAG